MHGDARAFVARMVSARVAGYTSESVVASVAAEDMTLLAGKPFARVLEVGSRDINGGVRDLFEPCDYYGLDLEPGPGVSEVADVTSWAPDRLFDAVVCCEVLEHAPSPEKVVRACINLLAPGARLILTAACDPRAPHSGHDGGPMEPGEHYANIDPEALTQWLADLDDVSVQVWPWGDVYATGTR